MRTGCRLAAVVHPAASVGRDVEIGEGTVVMAGCMINSGARVGRNVIVNTGATIDHDCEIADGVHIGPGSHLCGNVAIGSATLIGAGNGNSAVDTRWGGRAHRCGFDGARACARLCARRRKPMLSDTLPTCS